jgi:hypothetical protein
MQIFLLGLQGIGSKARILVMLNVRGKLPKEIELEYQGFIHTQSLDYERVPFRCQRCHEHGHIYKDFPRPRYAPKSAQGSPCSRNHSLVTLGSRSISPLPSNYSSLDTCNAQVSEAELQPHLDQQEMDLVLAPAPGQDDLVAASLSADVVLPPHLIWGMHLPIPTLILDLSSAINF